MQTKSIKQTAILPCSPQTAYDAWLDSKTHGEMINGNAKIDPQVGGLFSIWDGYLIGKTTKLEPKKHKITQQWRDDSTDWPENHYSELTVEFEPHEDNETKVVFSQKDIPAKHAQSISEGWKEYYWGPMEQYFEENK